MDQNFSLMAQSRANYYTAGSPVQFVRVELLKGDTTGEVAVCLTFKNVGTEPLTGLVVHFKCKDAAGQVLCEDDFYYEQLNAQPGAVFGSDDAVYVSDTPVSSVEVEQDRAFLNGRGVDLRNYKRVRLNMPRVLPGSIAKTLQQRTGNVQLTCVPQDTEYGWFCACGAFHPNEENTTVCSECGGDRAGIKATLTAILEEARQAAERQQQEVNAVASSVAPAPAPAPQPQAQPAAAARPQQPPVAAPTPEGMPAGGYMGYPPPMYYPNYPYPYGYPPQGMPAPPEPKVINTKPVSLEEMDPVNALGKEQAQNLELILGVPLQVTVEIGRTQRKVQEILEFSKGSLLVLDKLAGDQVDLFVNGKCIAKGDVVVIDDNFGVRITEIVQKPGLEEQTGE